MRRLSLGLNFTIEGSMKKVTTNDIIDYLRSNPEKSNHEIAAHFKCNSRVIAGRTSYLFINTTKLERKRKEDKSGQYFYAYSLSGHSAASKKEVPKVEEVQVSQMDKAIEQAADILAKEISVTIAQRLEAIVRSNLKQAMTAGFAQ